MKKRFVIITLFLFLFIFITLEIIPRINPQIILLFGDYISTIMISNLEFAKKRLQDKIMVKPDKELGYVLRPNKTIRIKTSEYDFMTQFYALKIDDIEIGVRDKISNLKDIFGVAIGDSYTFCYGLSDEECWVEILQNKLGKEVLNLGVFGYGSAQEYLMLYKVGLKLKPMVVIWQFNFLDPADDRYFLSDNFYPIPHPQNIFRKSPFPLSHSVVLSIIDALSIIYVEPIRKIKALNYIKDAQEEIIDTAENIERAFKLCKENNIHFFLVFMPEHDNLSLTLQKSLCHKIPCIKIGFQKEHFFSIDGHLNPAGSNYAAEKIYEYIKSSL